MNRPFRPTGGARSPSAPFEAHHYSSTGNSTNSGKGRAVSPRPPFEAGTSSNSLSPHTHIGAPLLLSLFTLHYSLFPPLQAADPASLDNLHDITTQPPVPLWPPAPGWYFIAILLLILAGTSTLRAIRRYRANAYRRAALRLLDKIPNENPLALAELLKRTALAIAPRHKVAALTGEHWLAFLQQHAPQLPIPAEVRTLLTTTLYARPATPPEQTAQLRTYTAQWIRKHTTTPTAQPRPAR